jgi:hypothetical protein
MAQSVFLVHDVIEKPFARQLAIDLSLAGATVFLDEAEIGATQDSLIRYIVKAVLGDVCLAIILSPNSVGSDWVQYEVESFMNQQQLSGLTIKVMPLLYKDCAMPAFMADNICADFRNPANYTSMLSKVIERIELSRDGKGTGVPASLAGMWQGSWIWCGRNRDADMVISASSVIPSRMVIRYIKSGILAIVEQELDVRISGNAVKLIGTNYRLIEHGISLGWNLDTFNLSLGASGTTLEGINTDKRGTQSPVLFIRK